MSTSSSRPNTRSLIAGGLLVAWIATLVFGWALQPIEDTVPVVVDPGSELAVVLAANPSATPEDAPRSQLVVCNSLFAGAPRDLAEPLPELRVDYVFDRPPCESPHAAARLAAVANVLGIMALVAGWIFLSRRTATVAPDRFAATIDS